MECAALYELMKPEIEAALQEIMLKNIKSLITIVKKHHGKKTMQLRL